MRFCTRTQSLTASELHFSVELPCIMHARMASCQSLVRFLELGADPDKACVGYNWIVAPSPREIATQHVWTDFGLRRGAS